MVEVYLGEVEEFLDRMSKNRKAVASAAKAMGESEDDVRHALESGSRVAGRVALESAPKEFK